MPSMHADNRSAAGTACSVQLNNTSLQARHAARQNFPRTILSERLCHLCALAHRPSGEHPVSLQRHTWVCAAGPLTPVTPDVAPSPAKDTVPVNAAALHSIIYTTTSRNDCGASSRILRKLSSASPGSTAALRASQITHVLALRAAAFSRSATRPRFNPDGEMA